MFKQPWNLAVYGVVILTLSLDFIYSKSYTLWIALPILFLWDVFYSLSHSSFEGREPRFILDQVVHSKTLISYFLPIYSLFIGMFFTVSTETKIEIIQSFINAGVSIFQLMFPLILSCIALLLIPIHISNDNQSTPSTNSLRSLLAIVIFSQQATVIIFTHSLLRVTPQLMSVTAL